MELHTLNDLFEHELQDLHSAEEQIIKALPKMIEKVSRPDLKDALTQHLEQTRGHLAKVAAIAKDLDIKVKGAECRGMKGVIAEGEEIIGMVEDADLLDAAIIMAAQRVEHYEIAGYGTAAAHAQELGYDDIVQQLVTINAEEYEADSILTDLAESRINAEADIDGSSNAYA